MFEIRPELLPHVSTLAHAGEGMFYPAKASTWVYLHECGREQTSWLVRSPRRSSGPLVGFLIQAFSPKCKWSCRPLGREHGSQGRMSDPGATLLEPASDSSSRTGRLPEVIVGGAPPLHISGCKFKRSPAPL